MNIICIRSAIIFCVSANFSRIVCRFEPATKELAQLSILLKVAAFISPDVIAAVYPSL
jgi:hypothetical protein